MEWWFLHYSNRLKLHFKSRLRLIKPLCNPRQRLMHFKYWIITYLVDFITGAAVDISSRAVLTKEAWKDVAQGQETAVSLAVTDDSLLVVAAWTILLVMATMLNGGHGHGGSEESEESGGVLHCDGGGGWLKDEERHWTIPGQNNFPLSPCPRTNLG